MNKRKILEILITALISAGIAFLTNLLGLMTEQNLIHVDPVISGGIGGIITTARRFIC